MVGVTAIAAALAVTAALAGETEQKIPVSNLPKNVVAIVKVICPGGTMLSAEKEVETEGGKVRIEYEVTVRQQNGKVVEIEIVLDRAGNIRKVQVEDDDDDDEDDDDDDDD